MFSLSIPPGGVTNPSPQVQGTENKINAYPGTHIDHSEGPTPKTHPVPRDVDVVGDAHDEGGGGDGLGFAVAVLFHVRRVGLHRERWFVVAVCVGGVSGDMLRVCSWRSCGGWCACRR